MSKYRKCYSNEALVRKIPKGILKYSCRNALIKNYQSFFFFFILRYTCEICEPRKFDETQYQWCRYVIGILYRWKR